MKAYENKTRLPANSHIIMRLDGRSFHTFTRGLQRPFDPAFVAAMNATAEALCAELAGVQFAYTQSDEISLYITDTLREESDLPFGGAIQKLVSVSAAIATAHFNRNWTKTNKIATFDSRIFALPEAEVYVYFDWRQKDCSRNAIQSYAQSIYSHRQLLNQNQKSQLELLESARVIWEDVDPAMRYGRITQRIQAQETVTFTHKKTNIPQTLDVLRSRWETCAAPLFRGKIDCASKSQRMPPDRVQECPQQLQIL